VRRTALILVSLALGGCSFGDEDGGPTASAAQGERLVLSADDVGRPFAQFDEGEQRRTDMAPPRDDPDRFGREGGWKSRFQRGGTTSTRGPLVIESRADLFETVGGANDDFDLYKEALDQLASGAGGETLERGPRLGEESYAVTFRQGAPPTAVRHYAIAWREGNVTGYVFANGFDGRMTLAHVVALARKQEQRIARATNES
jgi:hypothetical protein